MVHCAFYEIPWTVRDPDVDRMMAVRGFTHHDYKLFRGYLDLVVRPNKEDRFYFNNEQFIVEYLVVADDCVNIYAKVN
jgi:hypothetical protein